MIHKRKKQGPGMNASIRTYLEMCDNITQINMKNLCNNN